MIPSAKNLKVEIIGDARSYSKALGDASNTTNSFGSSLLKLGKYAAIGLGAAGVGGAVLTLKRGFDELKESQQVMAQTNAVIKSTGGAAEVTAKQVEGMASSLSLMSGADDEAIQAGENMLLTFTNVRNEAGKGNDIFNQATSTLTDFAFAMNRGAAPSAEQLSKNAILLGKALNDPIKGITALRRVGVAFTEDQVKQIDALVKSGHAMDAQKLILRELNKEFGGSAKAAGETFPGQLNKLKNAFDEVAGNLAAKLLPALTRLVSWISDHMPQIQAAVESAADAIGKAFNWLAGQVQTHWGTIKSVVTSAINAVISAVKTLTSFLHTDIGKSVATAAAAMGAFAYAMGVATKAIGALRAAAILLGGTPQLIAIGALLTGLTYLGIKLGLIHNPFNTAATDADRFADALNHAATSANATADALDKLKQTNINVDAAQARSISTLHDAQAAQRAYNEFVQKGTQNTLAGKQAHDQATSAWIAHKQAALDLTTAVKEQDAAQVKASQSVRQAVPGLTAFTKGLDDLAKLSGPAANKAAGALGGELLKVGQGAVDAAAKLQTTNPVAAATERSFGTLQKAAGTLLVQLGRVPTRTEIIAEAKTIGGDKFTGDLRTFVKASQDAGTDIPAWLRKAVAPSRKAAQDVADGVSGKADAARAAGNTLGSALLAGVNAGLTANIRLVLSTADSIIAQINSTMRTAAQAKSPSKLTALLGKDLVDGLSEGMLKQLNNLVRDLGPAFTKSIVGLFGKLGSDAKSVGVKGMGNAASAIIAAAKKAGVDARAALAVAMTEGGTSFGAVGDKGTSFGPFQLHIGGASPFGDPKKAAEFANSIQGITYALNQMAKAGAAGKTGFDAIRAIVTSFERPANPAAEIAKAIGYYKQIPEAVGGALTAAGAKTSASIVQTLQGFLALVKQYGPKIGKEQVTSILAGIDANGGNLVAKGRQAILQFIAAAKAQIAQSKKDLASAFAGMANDALSAFDEAAQARFHNKSAERLAQMQLEDQINAATKGVADAQSTIDAAVAKLAADQGAGADAATLAEDQAAITAAVTQLGEAQRAATELQLQLNADQEQKAHDKQMEADKAALTNRLIQLQTELAKHPEEYAKIQRQIIKLLKSYIPGFNSAGYKLTHAFSDGLNDGIAEVVANARKLANALEQIPGVGKGGGGATTSAGPQRPPDVPGGSRFATGGTVVNVTVNGDVTGEEVVRKVRDGLRTMGRNNALDPLTVRA